MIPVQQYIKIMLLTQQMLLVIKLQLTMLKVVLLLLILLLAVQHNLMHLQETQVHQLTLAP